MVEPEPRRVHVSIDEETLRSDPKVEMYGFSVPKEPYRPNEDTIIFSPEFGYAGVFDGLGGTEKGALASQTAGTFLSEALKVDLDGGRYITEFMYSVLGSAAREVSKQTEGDGQTTVAVVKLVKNNNGLNLVWASLGDSRIYILRRNGKLEQLNIDDNLLSEVSRFSLHGEHLEGLREVSRKLDDIAQERFREIRLKGGIKPPWAKDVFPNRGDAEGNLLEYLYFNRHIVRKALGVYGVYGFDRPNSWNIGVRSLRSGDRIALITDGIHDNLVRKNIRTILRSTTKDPAQALVKAAFKRSKSNHFRAKRDDMSAVVIDVKAA